LGEELIVEAAKVVVLVVVSTVAAAGLCWLIYAIAVRMARTANYRHDGEHPGGD
jgi:uncharacterized protein with PQ loop repeat